MARLPCFGIGLDDERETRLHEFINSLIRECLIPWAFSGGLRAEFVRFRAGFCLIGAMTLRVMTGRSYLSYASGRRNPAMVGEIGCTYAGWWAGRADDSRRVGAVTH